MSSVATTWAPASSSSNTVAMRRQARGEGKAGAAALEVGNGALEGDARRVLAARIFEALVNAGALLGVGRGRVDRHHDRAGRRVMALAAMDGARREGQAVPASSLMCVSRLRWLIRSMRVISPTNSVAVEDDRDLVALEHRQQRIERLVGLQGVQLRVMARATGALKRSQRPSYGPSTTARMSLSSMMPTSLPVVDAPAAARRRRGACGHRR